jgi:L-ascorbate metabolism protein UlaG (beta-lactamase superfamily)
MTEASHSSSVWSPGETEGVAVGEAVGFVFVLGGRTIYLAGDTGPFGDTARSATRARSATWR